MATKAVVIVLKKVNNVSVIIGGATKQTFISNFRKSWIAKSMTVRKSGSKTKLCGMKNSSYFNILISVLFGSTEPPFWILEQNGISQKVWHKENWCQRQSCWAFRNSYPLASVYGRHIVTSNSWQR